MTGMHHHSWLRCSLLGLLCNYHFKPCGFCLFCFCCYRSCFVFKTNISRALYVYQKADENKGSSYDNFTQKVFTKMVYGWASVWVLERGRKNCLPRMLCTRLAASCGRHASVGLLCITTLPPNLVLLFQSSISANEITNQFLESGSSSNSPLTQSQTWQHGSPQRIGTVETGGGRQSLGAQSESCLKQKKGLMCYLHILRHSGNTERKIKQTRPYH